jgi:predicted ATP-dependent endonuclease of OLD family
LDVEIRIDAKKPIVICGENNIGKTNLLRALNLFFNHITDSEIFNPKKDIPHHIYYGSQGAGSNTELIGKFEVSGKVQALSVTFSNTGEVSYKLDKVKVDLNKAEEILSRYRYFMIESNNVDVPKIISEILERDGLLPLDKKRAKQSKPLNILKQFIILSQQAISDIEKDINNHFKDLTDFDGILKDKSIKINFAEFDKLRDIVKTMTSITLYDGNNHGIASKGSGAQRAVLLSLMQFISKSTNKNIIWGIDEPEAFLQPSLQRRVSDVLQKIVAEKNQTIILTTHSQYFIDIKSLDQTYLFTGKISPRSYIRKPNEIFYEMNTLPVANISAFEKASLIKKHLGIKSNDGWEIMPFNIIVEGEEDKKYLELLFQALELPIPNILWSGGASKIAGYLQFYNTYAKEINFKPEFLCIFDNDEEGRKQEAKIKGQYPNISVASIILPRYDGKKFDETKADWEIEDFIPASLIFLSINLILKKEGYKVIKNNQINAKSVLANQNKQVLKYAEECCAQNNPSKEPIILDNEGRKKLLCQKFCNNVTPVEIATQLTESQKEFLSRISK